MLILTRRVQEAIVIADNVTITVLSIKGNQVRLGIEAPRDVDVHREEIYRRVKPALDSRSENAAIVQRVVELELDEVSG